MPEVFLVTGISRAGKSSFCRAVQSEGLGLTHMPLDCYLRPTPPGVTFIEWLATPDCVDWHTVATHLQILLSGRRCYCPVPNWARRSEPWKSLGGITGNNGTVMEPAARGYLLEGTQAFSYPGNVTARIFIATPDEIIAQRLTGVPRCATDASAFLAGRLARNLATLRAQVGRADLVVGGALPVNEQLVSFQAFLSGLGSSSSTSAASSLLPGEEIPTEVIDSVRAAARRRV